MHFLETEETSAANTLANSTKLGWLLVYESVLRYLRTEIK